MSVLCATLGACLHLVCLPAGLLAQQLTELSRQTQVQVLFDFTDIRGSGPRYCPKEPVYPATAVRAVIRHYGYSWDWVNLRTINVSAKPPRCNPAGPEYVAPECLARDTTDFH